MRTEKRNEMTIEDMKGLADLTLRLHQAADCGDEYQFQYYLSQINGLYKPTHPEMGTRYEHGTYRGYEHREPVRVEHHHYHHNKTDDDKRFFEINGFTKEQHKRIQIAVYDHY